MSSQVLELDVKGVGGEGAMITTKHRLLRKLYTINPVQELAWGKQDVES
jgi:hypothetical protein